MIGSRCHQKFGMLIGTVAWMGTEKLARWGDCVRKWFFRRGENTLVSAPRVDACRCLRPYFRKPPSVPSSTLQPSLQVPCLLNFPSQRSFGIAVSIFHAWTVPLDLLSGVTDSQFLPQMLSQRILARRLPQVAARSAIVPRASFSQISALRAAEIEDPLQVR